MPLQRTSLFEVLPWVCISDGPLGSPKHSHRFAAQMQLMICQKCSQGLPLRWSSRFSEAVPWFAAQMDLLVGQKCSNTSAAQMELQACQNAPRGLIAPQMDASVSSSDGPPSLPKCSERFALQMDLTVYQNDAKGLKLRWTSKLAKMLRQHGSAFCNSDGPLGFPKMLPQICH